MAAALTIAVLVALSVIVVRVGAVAMRLTGLPENVARFQCISALTGTGFTTRESEMIVNYPYRRRILIVLIILGNFGLVSVAGTVIVTFVDAGGDTGAMWVQVLSIAVAVCITFLVVTNKTLDRLMCGLIGFILTKATSLGQRRYQRILQLDNGFSVAEHEIFGDQWRSVSELSLGAFPLILLAIHGEETVQNQQIDDDFMVSPGQILVCYGSDAAHDMFEEQVARSPTVRI
jgi:hypothetical protein